MPTKFSLRETAYRVMVTYTKSDGTKIIYYYGPYSTKSLAKREYDKYKLIPQWKASIESAPIGEWTEEDPELRS